MSVFKVNLSGGSPGQACIVAAMAGSAAGGPNTVLKVRIGWGERVRPGHWTPIFIEATDPTPQAAFVEINAAQSGLNGMQVKQFFTIGPIPSTLTLYVPLASGYGDGPAVIIRDENSKTMARYPSDPENQSFYQRVVNGNMRFVGVSGLHTSLQNTQGQVPGEAWDVAYLEPELLPAAPIGYDSLDLLVLNEPDLLHLRGEQQQAIVDWVRGGGHLVLWPGDDPAPRAGPLIDALPCTILGRQTVNLTDRDLARLGLPQRFSGIRGRVLKPRPDTDAEAVDLFGTGMPSHDVAYRRPLGLGSILVAPVNLSQLQFEGSANGFWTTVLTGTSAVRAEDATTTYNNVDPYMRRQYGASRSLEDFLGNVPGAGKFGFSYVALVLLGMMVVVGPVDWFVLRKLGRQPWTWLTTTGWIILITGGAVFIGHVFKSGKLHYGSVRVIDQAGGATVGETSLAGIYSPRTTSYHLEAVPADVAAPDAGGIKPTAAHDPPSGWWSVVSTDEYSSRHGAANDMSFHQTDGGNARRKCSSTSGTCSFLREETTRRAADDRRDADVHGRGRATDPPASIAGVVRNLTGKPLTNVRIRVNGGVTPPIERIEPNGSVNVHASVDTSANPFSVARRTRATRTGTTGTAM